MQQRERMICALTELKFVEDGTSGKVSRKFTGHGAVFSNVDAYGDVIEPGAFSAWLADVKGGRQPWPSMLSQHGGWGLTSEDLTPVGVYVDLAEDGKGLKVDGELADTVRGNELNTLMRTTPRPAIDGLSIGYIPKEWEPRSKPEDPRRRLKRVDVVEISLVTFPANRQARAAAKSIEDIASIREAEDFLCARGFSKRESLALIARIKGVGPGDPVDSLKGGPGDPVAELAARISRNTSIFNMRT